VVVNENENQVIEAFVLQVVVNVNASLLGMGEVDYHHISFYFLPLLGLGRVVRQDVDELGVVVEVGRSFYDDDEVASHHVWMNEALHHEELVVD
jgi:hypothetical protein